MQKKISRKNAGRFFMLAIPVTFLILCTAVFVIISIFLLKEYSDWKDRFENSHLNSEFVVFEDSKEISASLQKKIDTFGKSAEDVETLELTPQEVVYILSLELEKTIPEDFNTYRGYVDSDFNSWNIYMQLEYKGNLLPWLILSLNKDEGEGVSLYFSTISLGNFNLTEYGFKNMITDMNRGLNDALLLVNQSDFTGRRYENIELEPSALTIKGRR